MNTGSLGSAGSIERPTDGIYGWAEKESNRLLPFLMMKPNQFLLDFNSEIHLDNFAGGGGASEAYKMETERDVDLAVNHNPPAVWMHKANHPRTRHFIEDVWAFDILSYVKEVGRRVGSAWFSPDCKHFSKAKGGALIEKRIRGLGWIMLKYVGIGGGRIKDGQRGPACPRVLYMENVEEFLTWGPLVCKRDKTTGRCVKADGTIAAKGEIVPLKHQWLVPCPKRAGTYFKKLIADFRARGATAAEWGTIVASDFGAPTIRKRLYLVVRFDGQPIVWPKATHGEGLLPKRTAAECIDFTLPCPSVVHLTNEEARYFHVKQRPLAEASNRRIAKGVERYVMQADRPFIVNLTHHGAFRVESIDEEFRTITGAHRGEKGLVMPFLSYAQHGGAVRPVTAPMQTIAASPKDQNQLCSAFVARRVGVTLKQKSAELPLKPEAEVDERPPQGSIRKLAPTFLAQTNTGVIGHRSDEEFSTISSRGTNQSLVACSLVKYYGTDQDPQIDMPLHCVTTKDRFGLNQSLLMALPLSPEFAERARLTAAFLRRYGIDFEGEFATTKSGLVIFDIGMRMFEPRELFLAQGFPSTYIIEYGIDADGKRIKLTKTQQIQMCGNSVSPPPAAALIAANNPEMAAWYQQREAA